MDAPLQSIDQVRATLIDLAIKFGPKLFTAIVILAAGVFAARWVGQVLGKGLAKFELEVPVRQLLTRLVHVLVVGLFLIMALQNLGVELLPLIAGLGVAGAGIALAMQGVLSNVVAGLTIIFTKPFRVGDWIHVVGVEGEVTHIRLFSTTLAHADRSNVVVPNRKIVGEILHNHGRMRQLDVVVGVAYDTDLAQAVSTLEALLRANARVLQDPPPVVQTRVLADSSIQIAVKPWVAVRDYVVAHGEINDAIVARFRAGGIVIPFPQRELRMRSA
ncbi:MAG: mechanosensitive ion channel [Burkholderiales bacterium]|jgi:small conductance mechanosensitive channel|nr:mechanosensitive ion channel [Burkholderiales bacterium]